MKRNLAFIVTGIAVLELTFNVTAQTPPTATRPRLPSSGWQAMRSGALTNRLSRGSTQVIKRIETAQQAAPTYVIGERGPDHKEWLKVTTVQNANGSTQTRTNRAFIELATGMNYWSDNEWKETRELIEPFSGGAIARYGPHKIIFANDLNTAGAVDVETPDGQRLRSTPLGLSYRDSESGKTVWLAEIQDCQGQIIGSNQVLYVGAFGKLADVRYTYRKSGWEQDVIFNVRLPDAGAYGLDPKSAILEITTEFLSPPQPVKSSRLAFQQAGVPVEDEDVTFGSVRFGEGKAFAAGSPSEQGIPVFKQWLQIDGRDVLVEQATVESLRTELDKLPQLKTASVPTGSSRVGKVMASRSLPPSLAANSMTNAMETASVTVTSQGLVWDYIVELNGSFNNYTLNGDTTYYVSGNVNMYGTNIFEGGAVIKYAPGAKISISPFSMSPSYAVFKSSEYRPVVFTARDDDTVGDPLYLGTLSGYYANPALYIAGNSSVFTLANVRFCYAQQAVKLGGNSCNFTNAQFINCEIGLNLGGSTATIRNALFAHVRTNFLSIGGSVVNGQHLTIDDSRAIGMAPTSPNGSSVSLLNSIIANVGVVAVGNYPFIGYYYNGFYISPTFGAVPSQIQSTPDPFQTSGSGHYYLAADSVFRNAGSAGTDAALKEVLKKRCTQPPVVLPAFMEVTGELTLFPQTPRYVSGAPDLGYYYDALDYTIANLQVQGGSVHVEPGTAIAVRNQYLPEEDSFTFAGFGVWEDSLFVSRGLPSRPNIFTTTDMVQETPNMDWGYVRWWKQLWFSATIFLCGSSGPYINAAVPSLEFEFSDFLPASVDYHLWAGMDESGWLWKGSDASAMNLNVQNCNFFGGRFNLGLPFNWDYIFPSGSIVLRNNVFDRATVNLTPSLLLEGGQLNTDLHVDAYNNLFRRGLFFHLASTPSTTDRGNWVFKDNLFDKVRFVQYTQLPLDFDYNAYSPLTQAELDEVSLFGPAFAQLQPTTVEDDLNGGQEITLGTSPPYQTGPLGNYYLSTSCPLYQSGNRGSRSVSDAGLYHYTTRTDQTKDGEQSGNVIIGHHYVATASSSSALPKDADTDGIADFVEDANGNGVYNAGTETDWQHQNSTTDPNTGQPVADAYSTIYDDIDLDGDGLPGAGERAFATNPLVRDNPLAAASLPVPDTASGRVIVPLPITASVGDAMFIAFTVNGEPAAARVHKVDGNWLAEWDTTMLLNGDYYVALEAQADGQSSSAMCPGKLVTVQNTIWFPDASLTVGDELNINAQTIHANGTWTMEIYDDQDNLFASLAGDVDEDGFCDYPDKSHQGVSLSLLDGEGNPLPSDYYTVIVTTHVLGEAGSPTPTAASSSTTTTRYRERRWHTDRPGKWVIAYQPLYDAGTDGSTDQFTIMNGAVGYVYANVVVGGSYMVYGGGAVMSTPGPAVGGLYDVMKLNSVAKWSQFKSDIGTFEQNPLVRNLFYFGHCESSLGRGNLGGNPDPNLSTDAVRLGAQLHNSRDWDIGAANSHPYRFVFICGCSSANTDLPLAFGIPKVKMTSTKWTQKYNLPRRAFLGFKGDIPVGGILGQPRNTMNDALEAFLTTFWNTWIIPGCTLQHAVDEAKQAADSVQDPSSLFYPIKPQIYGCSDLLFDER